MHESEQTDLTNSEQPATASSTLEVIEPEADDAQSEEEVSSPNPANGNEPASGDQPVIDQPANDNSNSQAVEAI